MLLTLVQTTLYWENPQANRTRLAQKLAHLHGRTNLIVLPEMFTTGFSMQAKPLAEPMDGPTVTWMAEQAQTLQAAMVGSFICTENGQYFNRLVFMTPDGKKKWYDKKHLFTLAGENEAYTAGKQHLTVEWQGWRIRPLICYDLRFPEWSRNKADGNGYDLLLYVANWPIRRTQHWQALLTARAIENQTYCAGVNICGKDGNDLEYSGDSAIIDFSGQTICRISGQEGIFTTELSLQALQEYRKMLPFLQDQLV
jgi:omega-amidase